MRRTVASSFPFLTWYLLNERKSWQLYIWRCSNRITENYWWNERLFRAMFDHNESFISSFCFVSYIWVLWENSIFVTYRAINLKKFNLLCIKILCIRTSFVASYCFFFYFFVNYKNNGSQLNFVQIWKINKNAFSIHLQCRTECLFLI